MPPRSEKRREYEREYRKLNREKIREYDREWQLKNKEKRREYEREYRKKYVNTPQGKKINVISKWKHRGIIFYDYDLLYDIYTQTTHCDHCKRELDKCSKSRKCLDHDHSITDTENVRGILCNSCNVKDVLH